MCFCVAYTAVTRRNRAFGSPELGLKPFSQAEGKIARLFFGKLSALFSATCGYVNFTVNINLTGSTTLAAHKILISLIEVIY